MLRLEIICIEKDDRFNPDQRILRIGVKNANGTSWSITQKDAIEGIKNKKWSFFVKKGLHTVDVIVSKSRFGNGYIKTSNDGDSPDNLLSLPECK